MLLIDSFFSNSSCFWGRPRVVSGEFAPLHIGPIPVWMIRPQAVWSIRPQAVWSMRPQDVIDSPQRHGIGRLKPVDSCSLIFCEYGCIEN
jgi:hypothetical protein